MTARWLVGGRYVDPDRNTLSVLGFAVHRVRLSRVGRQQSARRQGCCRWNGIAHRRRRGPEEKRFGQKQPQEIRSLIIKNTKIQYNMLTVSTEIRYYRRVVYKRCHK